MKTCKECKRSIPKLFSKGRCIGCARKHYKESPKTFKEKDNKSQEMDLFFIKALSTSIVSEESAKVIFNPSRVNVCHLFPKRNHPSVSCDKNNFIILTADEHSELDNMILDRHDFGQLKKRFPNSHEEIIRRMLLVLPNVKEKTNYKKNFKEYVKISN